MDPKEKTYLIVGGIVAAIVVLIFMSRRSSVPAPQVLQTASGGDSNQQGAEIAASERVSIAGINADAFKSILGFQLTSAQNQGDRELQLAEAGIARDISISGASAALQAQALQSASERDVALASSAAAQAGLQSQERISLANINLQATQSANQLASARELAQAQLLSQQQTAETQASAAVRQAQIDADARAQAAAATVEAQRQETARAAAAAAAQQAAITTQANAATSIANSQRNASIFNGIFSTITSVLPSILNRNSSTSPTIGGWPIVIGGGSGGWWGP
jgi:hypothetical protein